VWWVVANSHLKRGRGNGWVTTSDGHGFACTGHAGTGAGDQIVTRDIPVPVPAGNGYVTGT
jgi:hypothetical protein